MTISNSKGYILHEGPAYSLALNKEHTHVVVAGRNGKLWGFRMVQCPYRFRKLPTLNLMLFQCSRCSSSNRVALRNASTYDVARRPVCRALRAWMLLGTQLMVRIWWRTPCVSHLLITKFNIPWGPEENIILTKYLLKDLLKLLREK
jgi:hypothetical protein